MTSITVRVSAYPMGLEVWAEFDAGEGSWTVKPAFPFMFDARVSAETLEAGVRELAAKLNVFFADKGTSP